VVGKREFISITAKPKRAVYIDYCYCKNTHTHKKYRHYSITHIWLFLLSNPNLSFIHLTTTNNINNSLILSPSLTISTKQNTLIIISTTHSFSFYLYLFFFLSPFSDLYSITGNNNSLIPFLSNYYIMFIFLNLRNMFHCFLGICFMFFFF